MQSTQFDALREAMDPSAVTEARRKPAEDKTVQENASKKKKEETVSLDDAQDAKIAEARKAPMSSRISAIAEACDGIRDPSLTEQ